MNKDLIKQRFKKRLPLYNSNAKIQEKMAERLAELFPHKQNISILELGCGTGMLTKFAVQKMQFQKYTAIDIVSECENYIKKINSKIEFIGTDAEEYIKTCENYDLIISNASFQWVVDLQKFIEHAVDKLNPNGMVIFSIFGKENYREMNYVAEKSLQYYSSSELIELFKKYHPIVEEEIRIMAFKTPKDVLKHIRNTGVNAISAESWTKKDLRDFENRYNNFCSGHPTLTYNPIYVTISKIAE